MCAALHSTFAVGKKETLVELLDRVRQALPPDATARFLLSDGPFEDTGVDRVLKQHPEMLRFLVPDEFPKHLTGDADDWALLQAIAGGIPRRFPLSHAEFAFHIPALGETVTVTDSWRFTGRNRTLTAVTLDPPSEHTAQLLASFGKPKKAPPVPQQPVSIDAAAAVRAMVADYRTSLSAVMDRAGMPHDLPPLQGPQPLGIESGPLKPALLTAFKLLGYACNSGKGSHTLHRTAGDLTVQLELDTGTWSRTVLAIYQVSGAGFQANLPLPVAPRAMGSPQYPIGDAAQWCKIVENLAALVAELDRTLVPEIEQVLAASAR